MRLPKKGFLRLLRTALVSLLAASALVLIFRSTPMSFILTSAAQRAVSLASITSLFRGNHSESDALLLPAKNVTDEAHLGAAFMAGAVTLASRTSSSSFLYGTPVPARKAPSNQTPFYLTMPVSGKLGNRMFQYASLLGIAYLNGRTPFYPSASRLHRIFNATHVQDRSDKGYTVLFEKHFATYDSSFERLPDGNIALMQYFQSWKYFSFLRDTIRKEFAFQQGLLDQAAGLLNLYSAQIGRKVTVGVHVRRGDMVLRSSQKKGYHVAPLSYILRAMDYMRHKYGEVVFLIVSDDQSWCMRNLQKTGDSVIVDNRAPEVHMALLTLCDHVIMTVGTFGWWGGFLGKGEVVYYWDSKECLHEPPLPVEVRKPEDLFLPIWTRMAG